MPTHPESPPEPNFDRVAHLYRWAEYLTLGPLLQQTRTALLDHLAGCRQALLFGDGDGRFLAQLLRRYPDLRATAVDTSRVMLRLLQQRAERAAPTAAARLTLLHGPAVDAPIPPATDLIVTHFFLDCLPQTAVDHLIARVAAAAQPGVRWLVSDFAIPTASLLRPAARLYVRALYLAFRLLTGLRVEQLPDPQAALTAGGFRQLARHRKLGGLLYSELWVLDGVPAGVPDGVLAGVPDGVPDGLDVPARHNPAVPAFIHTPMDSSAPVDRLASSRAASTKPTLDAQPDPEPAVPSLPEPDPGVFHHEPSSAPSPVPSSEPAA